jgi:hypothetical protein
MEAGARKYEVFLPVVMRRVIVRVYTDVMILYRLFLLLLGVDCVQKRA